MVKGCTPGVWIAHMMGNSGKIQLVKEGSLACPYKRGIFPAELYSQLYRVVGIASSHVKERSRAVIFLSSAGVGSLGRVLYVSASVYRPEFPIICSVVCHYGCAPFVFWGDDDVFSLLWASSNTLFWWGKIGGGVLPWTSILLSLSWPTVLLQSQSC